MKVIAAFALFTLSAAAQDSGWQVLKDRKQLCQISVPGGWTADKIMPGSVTSPDKKSSVIFGSKPASVDYAAARDSLKSHIKKLVEQLANH